MGQTTRIYGGLSVTRNPNSSNGTESMLTVAEVTITPAQMLTLRATPITIVPAPGPGMVITFIAGFFVLDFITPAYAGPQDLALKYGDASGVVLALSTGAGFVDAAFDAGIRAVPQVPAVVPRTACENKALVLHNTGAAEMTAGNSPLRVKVFYQVIKTGW